MLKGILLVDHNPVVRTMLRDYLESQPGLEVCGEASDGVEAIEKARKLSPALIIMDLSRPRMSGLEAAQALHPVMPAVPTIPFTLHKDAVPHNLASAAGISSVISKSDGMGVLMNEIQMLLEQD
ncbi:MAG TPA: response regulator transcription factor [Candidatus Acidoferrales bacterium]|nr:response regulator transcription factor [Candidatus Acidoferrales bacterium]